MVQGWDRRRKCRFTNINAENAEIHLKSWSLTQTKRKDLCARPAEIRTPAGSCPLFPAGLPLEVETWESALHRPAPPPEAVIPELPDPHSREL